MCYPRNLIDIKTSNRQRKFSTTRYSANHHLKWIDKKNAILTSSICMKRVENAKFCWSGTGWLPMLAPQRETFLRRFRSFGLFWFMLEFFSFLPCSLENAILAGYALSSFYSFRFRNYAKPAKLLNPRLPINFIKYIHIHTLFRLYYYWNWDYCEYWENCGVDGDGNMGEKLCGTMNFEIKGIRTIHKVVIVWQCQKMAVLWCICEVL